MTTTGRLVRPTSHAVPMQSSAPQRDPDTEHRRRTELVVTAVVIALAAVATLLVLAFFGEENGTTGTVVTHQRHLSWVSERDWDGSDARLYQLANRR